jgi:hypothetical protein
MEGRPHRLALKPFDKASGNDSYLRIPAEDRVDVKVIADHDSGRGGRAGSGP